MTRRCPPFCAVSMALALAPVPAIAQTRVIENDATNEANNEQQQLQDLLERQRQAAATRTQAGRTAQSAVGEVGQRQTRDQAAPNLKPLARIDTRIANRVQNRIRNRIDRDYDPQGNASTPFTEAETRERNSHPRR